MTASKETLRSLARPNGRDWIDIGQKLDPAMFASSAPEPVEEDGPLGWYVVCTNPRCEYRVQTGLVSKGFEVYLPQYKQERILARKGIRKEFLRVLLPRYVFVSAPFGSWPRITSTDGVQGLIRDRGDPVTVAHEAIELLLNSENAGQFDTLLTSNGEVVTRREMQDRIASVKPGVKMQITKGPFASFIATVVETIGFERAKVLVEIFSKATPYEIDLADLKAA